MPSILQRHRQSIGLWLLAVVFAVACVGLGRWQLHRYQDKHERAQLVARNYDAAPVPLQELLPSAGTPFDARDQWRPVEVTGTYQPDQTRLVRNRPRDAGSGRPTYGYEVLVPLRVAGGGTLLVDRGWLPNGTTGGRPGEEPDTVPAPPQGQVRVVARLRASEPTRHVQLPPNQVATIGVPQLQHSLGVPLYDAYAALVSETPSAAVAPAALDPPTADGNEGINASYAVQWVVFAALALGFPLWVARHEREAGQEAADPDGVGRDRADPDRARQDRAGQYGAAEQDGPDAPDGAVRVPAGRPRRRRIWDDDDEDAVTD